MIVLFANGASTVITSGGTTAPPAGTSETWTAATPAPFPSASTGISHFFLADLNAPSELMEVTNTAGATWAVTRGAEGTVPVAHASPRFTAWLAASAGTLAGMLAPPAGDIGGTATAPTVLSTHLTSPLPVAQGGTGAATQQAAINALTGAQSAGKYVRSDGANAALSAIQAGDMPDLAYVDSVTAGDSSVSVTGPADAPVIATGTLDAIAAAHPPAANWGNNGKKITSLANGSAASDAAAFGQIPGALPPSGAAGGDLSGSYPNPTTAKVSGVAITSAQATLLAQINNATTRSATATVLAGEETVFTGSTASQTLTLPVTPQVSTVNTVLNLASASVTLAAGAGNTINSFGTSGSLTLVPNALAQLVFVGTTWYVIDTNNVASAVGTLAIANGGTGQTGAAAALAALGGATDTAVVHLAGAETVTGAKTFSLPPALATQSVSGTATLAAASAPVVLTDTTSGAFTLTLPAAPVTGEWFILVDSVGKWGSASLTVTGNGKNIDGASSSLVLATTRGKLWLYYDGTAWWTFGTGALPVAGTATYALSVDRTGTLPVYTARNSAGLVVASAADTATTSGLKAVLTSIAPNNTDDFSIHLGPGRFHFLDAPLGTESWAGTEDHYQFVNNNNVTLDGEGPQSIISNFTNFTGASPDPQPVMLFGCSRWRIRNLSVESCGKTRSASNTINLDGVTNSVIEKVRVTSAIGHAIAVDGGYAGQWGGNTVIRDCLIQGRPSAPVLSTGSGGTLTVQTYTYALAWRCNGLGVFTATGTSSGTTATITTGSAHTYLTGDQVSISGMSVAGYNGTFTITVTSTTTFTYTTSGSNIGAGSGGTAIGADVTKPSDPTSIVTTSGQQKVTVTLQRGPYSCVGRVVYRWDGANWLQVGTVADNTTATFADNGITGSAVTFAHKSAVQGAGVEVMASNGCVVDGNVIDGTGDMVNGAASSQNGVHIVQKAVGAVNVPADHNTFVNNVVRQTGSHGIRVVGGSNNIIAGNQVSNPGTPTTKAQAIRIEGIAAVSTNSNLVTGNNTYDDQPASSWAGGASTSNSVSITATNTPTSNVLGPNVMTGFTSSSPVSDSGTTSQLEASEKTVVLMAQGTLSVTTKVSNFQFACPWPGIIKRARLVANTGPAGAALICDFLLNGTTIWTTSGNRVQIADGATSGTQTSFNTTVFNAGDVFTFNIAQVGSGTPGADLVMELTFLASRVYP